MNRMAACAITWPGSRVIVGDIPGAPVLEIASHDPRLDETEADWR